MFNYSCLFVAQNEQGTVHGNAKVELNWEISTPKHLLEVSDHLARQGDFKHVVVLNHTKLG